MTIQLLLDCGEDRSYESGMEMERSVSGDGANGANYVRLGVGNLVSDQGNLVFQDV